MEQQNFKVLEPASFFRGVGREAMRGRWGLIVIAGFIYVLLTNLPITVFDNLFGIPIDMDTFSSLYGDSYNNDMWSSIYGDTEINGTSPLSGIYTLLTGGAFSLGFAIFAIHILRRAEADWGLVFSGFSNYLKSLGVTLMVALLMFLWAMACFIPVAILVATGVDILMGLGVLLVLPAAVVLIIISFRYAMVYYILADNPGIGVMDCIKRSKLMMNQNKGKFFFFCLSFAGWFILYLFATVIVSFVVGMIMFMAPSLVVEIVATVIDAVLYGIFVGYFYTAKAAFYEKVSGISAGMFNLDQNQNPSQSPDMNQQNYLDEEKND